MMNTLCTNLMLLSFFDLLHIVEVIEVVSLSIFVLTGSSGKHLQVEPRKERIFAFIRLAGL